MAKLACLFPGQGSQSVGMGKDLYEQCPQAKQTFENIDSIAQRSLSSLCFLGPEEELKRTVNTQPTVMSVSLAAWTAYLKLDGPKPDFVAGHSLGEFSALVASQVLSLEDAVKLVETRASLMESCPKGAMSAVIGMDIDTLKDCCKQAQDQGVVIVANFNTKEQLVISGSPEAVIKAGSLAKEKGAKVIALPVGGAFHSPLMQSAAESFSQSLEPVVFNDAKIAVVQNCDARASLDGKQIKDKLSKQMPSAVLWLDTIQYMLEQGVDTFIEIGPGKALAGMVKKIERSAKVLNIYDHQSLTQAISELKSLTVQA